MAATLVSVGQEPVRRTPRRCPACPPVTRTTAISAVSATRSQTSGWPSWTRSPSAASQRITCPAKGVRTSVTPTRPTRSPTSTDGRLLAVAAGAGQQPGPGAASEASGQKMPARGADDDPLGHVEVFALVRAGSARHVPACADLVHQGVEVLRVGDRQRLDARAGSAWPGRSGPHPARARRGGQAQAGERLEGLAPAHRAAQLRRQESGPLGGVVVHVASTLATTGTSGAKKVTSASALRRAGRAPCMRGVWNAPDTGIGMTRLAPSPLASSPATSDGFGRTGDHHLSWCVVVGHPHIALGAHARCLGVVVSDAQQRRPSSPGPPRPRAPWPRPGRPRAGSRPRTRGHRSPSTRCTRRGCARRSPPV